ncbi:hypothetical protein TIFTF001_019907 [Ficus carica]|uniref:Uncharacterized protein n=1 Tax=Ficus carica TaxID=3494 RepID=A0AA88ADW1_FICCA|nr:hypothetical protein TIFTF001_019907 [Ficus carica]
MAKEGRTLVNQTWFTVQQIQGKLSLVSLLPICTARLLPPSSLLAHRHSFPHPPQGLVEIATPADKRSSKITQALASSTSLAWSTVVTSRMALPCNIWVISTLIENGFFLVFIMALLL